MIQRELATCRKYHRHVGSGEAACPQGCSAERTTAIQPPAWVGRTAGVSGSARRTAGGSRLYTATAAARSCI